MEMETNTYAIYNVKTGQLVARISPDGAVHSEGNLEAVVALQSLMQRDIVVREHQIDYDPQTADEDYDPYPEENMCYFGVVTLRPEDPSYLKAFLQRLQYVSHYEFRVGIPPDLSGGIPMDAVAKSGEEACKKRAFQYPITGH